MCRGGVFHSIKLKKEEEEWREIFFFLFRRKKMRKSGEREREKKKKLTRVKPKKTVGEKTDNTGKKLL